MKIQVLEEIKEKASKQKKAVILPESHDERVLKAAEILLKDKIASVITLGDENKINDAIKKLGLRTNGLRIIDPSRSDKLSDFTNIYFNLRRKKGITIEEARETMTRDVFFAAMMLKESLVDGSVAGSFASTADVLKAGIQCIGMPEGISVVSSFFLIAFPEKTSDLYFC